MGTGVLAMIWCRHDNTNTLIGVPPLCRLSLSWSGHLIFYLAPLKPFWKIVFRNRILLRHNKRLDMETIFVFLIYWLLVIWQQIYLITLTWVFSCIQEKDKLNLDIRRTYIYIINTFIFEYFFFASVYFPFLKKLILCSI